MPLTQAEEQHLLTELRQLSPPQLDLIKDILAQLRVPMTAWRNPQSQLMSPALLDELGDALRVHHALSDQVLTKHAFEHAFKRALNRAGRHAELSEVQNLRGCDLTIDAVRVSVKTEAARGIRATKIHISKWMELGRGHWELPLLRDAFLEHLNLYDEIYILRCLHRTPYHYELVEVPKALMLEAANAELVVQEASRQNPKPGYGYVRDPKTGTLLYALYFDAGSERKLQLKHLDVRLCVRHGVWQF